MTQARLASISPPNPPTDLIAAALAIPIHAVGEEHVGRKLRLVVQIVEVDATGTHALVTSAPPSQPGLRPTLLLDLTTALLGQSPGANAVRPDTAYAPSPASLSAAAAAGMNVDVPPVPSLPRKLLSLSRGEWICVVGWLERSDLVDQVLPPPGYAPPLRAVLEAIHVAQAREPPVGARMRGEVTV